MQNKKIIKALIGNQFFSVTFTKKNGEERTLNGRLGVKKHLKGGEKSYNDDDFNYLTVYDVQNNGYRTVNLDTVSSIKVNGKELVI